MLDAEGGISFTRYTGFGIAETDVNAFGPNYELDGFGLSLWALRKLGDDAFIDAHWDFIANQIADPLVALIDRKRVLLQKDSSIWESHTMAASARGPSRTSPRCAGCATPRDGRPPLGAAAVARRRAQAAREDRRES